MERRVFLLSILAVALLGVLLPEAALAWGPATHLELAGRILADLARLPAPTAALLAAHPLDYCYGTIAADIVVAKRFSHYLHHCHRWTVGLEVLDSAQSPSQQAFAHGYLSHLAADVVAHNYFVPYKMILGFNARARSHAFWEIRFDTFAPEEVWTIPKNISRRMHLDNDELLKKVLSRQLFSFQTNKVFFNNVVLLGRFRSWHNVISRALSHENPALSPERVARYKEISLDAILSVLCEREEAWCFRADPTGHQSLTAAAAIGRRLRRAFRKGELSRDLFCDVVNRYRPHLEASIYAQPNAEELVRSAVEVIEGGEPAAA